MFMTYFIAYIATAIVFLSIDAIWLGVVAKSFFSSNIGHLMTSNINFVAAAGFYLLYAIGIVFFAIKPALDSESLKTALLYGALFGFFCYGTYEMTNFATLKDWPVKIVIVDMAWGTFLTTLSAGAGYFVVQTLIK